MANLTTRAGKGAALTHQEVDDNFTGLNTELGQKEVAANKGVANGYASLDASGRVPSGQLPGYVDDVLEFANLAAFPATGETGKIYVALDTNKVHRWSGSAYVEISASPGSTDSVAEGTTNLYFTQARARASVSASGSLSYNSGTGVFSYTQPTNVSTFTNDAGYITSSASITGNAGTATRLHTGRTIAVTGDVTGTSVAFDGSANLSFATTLANSGVTAGTYGSSSAVPVVTVDAKGRVTGVSTSAISGSLTFTGDVTGSGTTGGSTTLTLANSGVTAGSYGSASAIPVITVDAKGRLTGVSTSAVSIPSGSLTFTGDVTGTGTTGSSTALTLANSGVTAGTYTKVTVDAKGRVTTGASLASGDLPTYTGTLTSSQVTTALGFTPYNSTNPAGYITSASLSSYLPLSGGTLTGDLRFNNGGAGRIAFADNYHGMILRGHPSDAAGTINVTDVTSLVQHSGDFRFYRTNGSINELYFQVNATAPYWRGNTVLHAGNYTSYSPSLTGTGASGTWTINITGNTSGATLPQYYGTGYNWNGTAVQHYWTRIANVTGADGWAMVLVTTKQDVNYVPAGAYLLSIARFNNTSFSVKVDAINSHDTNLLVRIDNSGGVWVKANVEWNSQKAWRVIASLGENVMYGSYNSETLSTPANSIELSPGQQVRGTQGAATSASVATSQNRFGSIDSIGTIAASGAITQAGNQVLHAGNYSGYFRTVNGNSIIGSGDVSITASDNTKLPLSGGTLTGELYAPNISIGGQGRSARSAFGGNIGATAGSWNNAQLEIKNTDAGTVALAFHRAGYTSDTLEVRDASGMRLNGNFLLHAGNYTSYSPSLTGSGASGTWGISISGNAATVGGYAVGNSTNNIAYFSGARNLFVNNPENYSGEVRLGAAWDRGGVYASNTLSLSTSGSEIHFVFGNDTKAWVNSSRQINAGGGYISNSNPWGTSNSAFFPNGITTANATNWIYGHCYLGNAPSNGSGAEVHPNGRYNSVVSSGAAMQVRRSGSGGTATNTYTALFEQDFGNHSWGIVGEFRIGASGGGDRPSILFSNGFNDETWSVGYGFTDSNFRINRDHGHRNGSWGTTLMIMDRSGNVTFSGNVTAYSDRRLKTDIKRIENAGDIVRRLEGVSFKYREDGRDGIGLIAQDVEMVLPQIVGEATSSDGSTHKNVAYGNVVAVLIEAIKELQSEVKTLKHRLH